MSALSARIAGIGFWTRGLPSWDAARAFVASGALPEAAPAKPSPQLLPANERRRAPESVAVALDVALAACAAAQRDPATLPSVFASTHGDLAITDSMCATLAGDPRGVSPTKFHNSVHNAAAGYWTIGAGCVRPATALAAWDATFAQGLIEALAQLAEGDEAVLLVGYDTAAVGPLRSIHAADDLLGGALVLSRDGAGPRLVATLVDGDADAPGALGARCARNPMAPMLPLFDALASGAPRATLQAGAGRALRLEIAHD
ncbi:MAG: beta-ketoacyl synthase chain length factor [Pseudomonadota bacterium]